MGSKRGTQQREMRLPHLLCFTTNYYIHYGYYFSIKKKIIIHTYIHID